MLLGDKVRLFCQNTLEFVRLEKFYLVNENFIVMPKSWVMVG